MMKYRIWTFVTDGGDGEYHSHQYPTKEAGRLALNLDEYDMDEFGYHVDINTQVVDMTGYEVVE